MDSLLIDPGRADSGRRLFLEAVQHINSFREPNGIDRPVGIPPVVLDDLENTGTFALPGLGVGGLPADLHQVERVSKVVDHLLGKFEQVGFCRPNPVKWLFGKGALHHTQIIYPIRYEKKIFFRLRRHTRATRMVPYQDCWIGGGRRVNVTRHTFGSQMAMAGADPFAIMKAMGHADIKTTMIYVSLVKSHIRDQVEKLNAICLIPPPTREIRAQPTAACAK